MTPWLILGLLILAVIEGSDPRHDIVTADRLLLIALLVPVLGIVLRFVFWVAKEALLGFVLGLAGGIGLRMSGFGKRLRG
jgi:uncharacterized membrane protein YraQ (UPF0718 family)